VAGGGDSESFKIMYLRFVLQEDVSTIAAKLEMKPNTVSQRIKYYVQRLRDAPGGWPPGWRDE
jgi:hypothetical protein